MKHINHALVEEPRPMAYKAWLYWGKKPPNIVRTYVENYCPPGGVVMDPTAAADKREGRGPAPDVARKQPMSEYSPKKGLPPDAVAFPSRIHHSPRVHGNYFAHRMRHSSADDGTALVAIRDPHPGAQLDIVAYAVESVVVSHQSLCDILDLPRMPELDQLVKDLEGLQKAAGG